VYKGSDLPCLPPLPPPPVVGKSSWVLQKPSTAVGKNSTGGGAARPIEPVFRTPLQGAAALRWHLPWTPLWQAGSGTDLGVGQQWAENVCVWSETVWTLGTSRSIPRQHQQFHSYLLSFKSKQSWSTHKHFERLPAHHSAPQKRKKRIKPRTHDLKKQPKNVTHQNLCTFHKTRFYALFRKPIPRGSICSECCFPSAT